MMLIVMLTRPSCTHNRSITPTQMLRVGNGVQPPVLWPPQSQGIYCLVLRRETSTTALVLLLMLTSLARTTAFAITAGRDVGVIGSVGRIVTSGLEVVL